MTSIFSFHLYFPTGLGDVRLSRTDIHNIDAQVVFPDQSSFLINFFTPENIRFLMRKNEDMVFVARDMVIISSWDLNVMVRAVNELIESGELFKFCSRSGNCDVEMLQSLGIGELHFSRDILSSNL